MVRRGLVETTEVAAALIADGVVRVSGAVADKPSRSVAPREPIIVDGPPPRFVSRGGDELDAALDAFEVDAAALGGPFEIVVVDVSFISLTSVADAILRVLAAPGADLVALVKPQFEVPRAVASKGRGVVTDPKEWDSSVERVRTAFEARKATMMGVVTSPIKGASGNTEFFLHAVAPER